MAREPRARMTAENARNLKTGFAKVSAPVEDDSFRELLAAIDKAARKS